MLAVQGLVSWNNDKSSPDLEGVILKGFSVRNVVVKEPEKTPETKEKLVRTERVIQA